MSRSQALVAIHLVAVFFGLCGILGELIQADASVIVEIRHNGETAQVGGDGAYLAHIEVPPAEYSESLVDEESGEVVVPSERLPLDTNTIKVTLWPTA